MEIEDPAESERPAANQKKQGAAGFAKEVGRDVAKDLFKEVKITLKWALGGAVLVGAVLGAIGLWKFGLTGLGIGALAGALVGGIGAALFYLSCTTL